MIKLVLETTGIFVAKRENDGGDTASVVKVKS
jgi:hypothetical protein